MKQKEKTSPSPTGSNPSRPYPRFAQDFSAGGKTQQNFKASCDVNVIVAHYTQTGVDPHADRIGKQNFGFATSRDFSDAMQKTAEINSAFAEQPSEIRSRFRNDPSAWLDHVLTPPDPIPENQPPESPQEPSTAPNPAVTTPENGGPTTPVKKDGD